MDPNFKLRKMPVFTFGVYKNWGKTFCDNTKNYTRQLQGGWEKECAGSFHEN